MIKLSEIRVELDDDMNKDVLLKKASKVLGLSKDHISSLSVSKRSIDSRKKNDIFFSYSVVVDTDVDEASLVSKLNSKQVTIFNQYQYVAPENNHKSSFRPIVVGFGPAGMFCALILARAGLNPIVLERGSEVSQRIEDVKSFFKTKNLNTESNVQFGEGGAGTFSDGKLTTGIKSPFVKKVFDEFFLHGAPEDILYSATPHIGTDKLVSVVKNIRKEIISLGGSIEFNAKLKSIEHFNDFIQVITYEKGGKEFQLECDTLVLAIGHSSRDTVSMLYQNGIEMIQKPFSIGARIEHPRSYIDQIQYGSFASHPALPAAVYKLAAHFEHERGGYTFCMCPGGTVISAASEKGGVVTNGMSEYARNKENSNAAILVNIYPEDLGSTDPLSGFEFQRKIEQAAFKLGGESYAAPAQMVGDFLNGVHSTHFGSVRPSFSTGVVSSDIRLCLPKKVCDTIAYSISKWDTVMKGFAMKEAVLTAPESRSSSPVRIVRDDVFQTNVRGIYPCGEGAGYAGGIVSAAVDGIKCAHAILEDIH